LTGIGELLITAGLVVALFLCWQLWWTGIDANASAQAVAVVRKYYQENLQGKTDRNEEALRVTLDSVYDRALDSIPTPAVNPEAVKIYTTEGGVPHLDGEYTVFGQVIKGMEVIDAIAACETDQYDNPKDKVEIVEMTIVRAPKGK